MLTIGLGFNAELISILSAMADDRIMTLGKIYPALRFALSFKRIGSGLIIHISNA